MRKAIYNKARKYSRFDYPYLICINTLDTRTSGERDVINAIWGTEALSIKDDMTSPVRIKNGVFFDNNGPKIRNVSAILITKVNPYNFSVADYWLYENPFALNKLDFSLLDLTSNHVIHDQLRDTKRKTFKQIFTDNSIV